MPARASVALATCARFPDGVADDAPLRAALHHHGAEVHDVVWDDARVDWSGFDLVLVRSTWDYMERRERFVAWAHEVEKQTRLWNPAATLAWNTHKGYLAHFESQGVPCIPTRFLPRGTQVNLAQELDQNGWSRAFLKPAVGATARKTTRFQADGGDLAAVQAQLDVDLAVEDMLLQPYQSRVEQEGEVSMVFIDGALTHAVQKLPVPGDYRTQDDFDATDHRYTPGDAERIAAWKVAHAIRSPWRYARIDFLRGDDGAFLLTEVELVEPVLFFAHDSWAADRLAVAVMRAVNA